MGELGEFVIEGGQRGARPAWQPSLWTDGLLDLGTYSQSGRRPQEASPRAAWTKTGAQGDGWEPGPRVSPPSICPWKKEAERYAKSPTGEDS